MWFNILFFSKTGKLENEVWHWIQILKRQGKNMGQMWYLQMTRSWLHVLSESYTVHTNRSQIYAGKERIHKTEHKKDCIKPTKIGVAE